MKIAMYARYSTSSQDRTSIDGQFRNCEQVAERHGFEVVAQFSDEAYSGTDDDRPGFMALLDAAARGEFDGIIIDETSRITRNSWMLTKLIEDLTFRNQFLMDTKDFDSRHESATLLAGIYGGLDRLELQKIRDRTHRGLRERHLAGYSAGGKVYGYRTEPTDDQKRVRVIDEDQAAIVREIFQFYADGRSPKWIANELNRRGVPSPGSLWKRTQRRTSGWMHTALVGTASRGSGMLRNKLYVGRVIWNKRRSKKVPGTGRRVFELRPESEWITIEAPELRIIDDALWTCVQERLQHTRQKYRPKITPRPRGGQSRYLLSGLLKCGSCGANFIMADSHSYRCSSHTNGGQHACNNDIRVRRDIAETGLLDGIQRELLAPATIAYVSKKVALEIARLKREHRSSRHEVQELQSRLREIDDELTRVADAIARIGISDTLERKLSSLENEQKRLNRDLARADNAADALPDLVVQLGAKWRSLVSDMAQLAQRPAGLDEIQNARNELRRLLGDVILLPNENRSHLVAHVELKHDGLFSADQTTSYESAVSGSGGALLAI